MFENYWAKLLMVSMIIGTTGISFFLRTDSSYIKEPLNKLEPLYFPSNTFAEIYKDSSASNLPLLGTTVSFSEQRKDPDFPDSVVDLIIRMDFNAEPIRFFWQQEVTQIVQNAKECSQQQLHSFTLTPGEDSRLHGTFHIKSVCNSGVGNIKSTIETDVLNDMRLAISKDEKKLSLNVVGSAKNNVPDLAKDFAKLVGNGLTLNLITSVVLGLDERIFAALKVERDALSAVAREQNLETIPIPDIEKLKKLDFVYHQAKFKYVTPQTIGAVIELRTSSKNPISVSQAKLFHSLFKKKHKALGSPLKSDIQPYHWPSWGDWLEVTGNGTTNNALAATAFNNKLFLFGIEKGGGNREYVNSFDGKVWSGWREVGGGGTTKLSLSATVFNGRIYLFGVSNDNSHNEFMNTSNDGDNWSGWSEVPGGGTTNLPLNATVFGNKLLLFGVSTDSHEFINTFDGTNWSGWSELPLNGTTQQPLSSTIFNGRLYLFGVSPQGDEFFNTFDGQSWSGWQHLGVGYTSLSLAATTFKDRIFLFGVSSEGNEFVKILPSNGKWSDWYEVPVGGRTNLALATTIFNDQLFLFGVNKADSHEFFKILSGD